MDYLTTKEAGEILKVTPQRVLVLIHAGRLPAKKVGRDWLIIPDDVEKFEKLPQGNFSLTPEEIEEIVAMSKEGKNPQRLAKKFKVSVRTIYRYINK